MKKRRETPNDRPGGLTHNPFAALRGGSPAPTDASEPERAGAPAHPTPPAAAGTRVVVRREKRGRAGKTVTRVSGLGLEGDDLAALARELKRALGCGATVEGPDVLLQGALTERAAKWLEGRLGARVTIGN